MMQVLCISSEARSSMESRKLSPGPVIDRRGCSFTSVWTCLGVFLIVYEPTTAPYTRSQLVVLGNGRLVDEKPGDRIVPLLDNS